MAWRDVLRKLLGVSAYQPPRGIGPDLNDATVERIRENLGGNLALQPTTLLRWYLASLEEAQAQADAGNLMMAAQLCRSMRRDGVISGLMGTLTSGLVRLPKKFYGDEAQVEVLSARTGTRSLFDDMVPPSELALLIGDGYELGVGVGELVPVPGRDFPIFIRLEPEFLRYRWVENRWYYTSVAGMLPITPGDGRWVLHTPGGRIAPWLSGKWPALGRSYINKEHAMLHRSNYSSKLANAARAAIPPAGATESFRSQMIARLIRWGTNTVFELPPGWDVKIIETKGEGWKVFQEEIDTCDREFAITIAGQVVTVEGGTGFSNMDIHQAIRADIVQTVGADAAYTVNTQILPAWIAGRWGANAINEGAIVEWDVKRPKEQKDEADGMKSVAEAITELAQLLAAASSDQEIDLEVFLKRYDIPLRARAAVSKPIDSGKRDGDDEDGVTLQ